MLKSVEQLREVFAVGNNLKLYADFKRKTFAHACQEINDNYDIGLRFEELKEGRKVVAVKFFFKQTIITQVTNQKTGVITNIYDKPKSQTTLRKKSANNSLQKPANILADQFSFNNPKIEAKPMKSILSSFLAKFKSFKK
jgi:plasmid replication initiation protein